MAKRGLGFASERVGLTVVRDGWDPNFAGSPMAGVPREAQRLVTLSERSDEGSQGAHSMSVSVSSQPSVSGVNSEDGDRESSHPRDDDRSLREFPVDELEPVNLDDVRVFRMQHPRGAFSGHSSRRSSPAATPSRRNSRRHDGARAEGLGFDDAYATRAAGFRTDYPNRDAYGGNGARAYDRGAYDARGYATRVPRARASPVVSREGPRIPPGVGDPRGSHLRLSPARGSRSAATSAAASPAPCRPWRVAGRFAPRPASSTATATAGAGGSTARRRRRPWRDARRGVWRLGGLRAISFRINTGRGTRAISDSRVASLAAGSAATVARRGPPRTAWWAWACTARPS